MNWNEEIQIIFRAKTVNAFNAFEADIEDLEKGAIDCVNRTYATLESELESMSFSQL